MNAPKASDVKLQVEIARSDVGPYSQLGLVAGFRGILNASQAH